MSEFEIDPKDIDYEALPPLVGPGEDRDEVINTLVDAWCTDLITGWPEEHTSEHAFSGYGDSRVVHGVVLDHVKLQDSDGTPIDLIDLLNRVADTLRTRHPDIPSGALRQCRVVLRACSIPSCQGTQGRPLNLPCDFVSVACKFAAGVNFTSAAFAGLLVAWLVIEQAASVLIEVQFDGLARWLLLLGMLACVGSLLWMWGRVVRESWLKRRGLARPAHLGKDHWKVVSEFEHDLESRIAGARQRLARAAGVSRSEPGGEPT